MYRLPVWDMLSQGDIFRRRCVFPYTASLTEDYLVVPEGQEAPVPHSEVQNVWNNGGSEAVLMPTYSHDLFIVLSNSCDAESEQKQPLELVLVGAILPLATFSAKNQDNCRSHKLTRFHYLREHADTGLPESFVHFGLVAAVRQEALFQSKNLRILSLDYPHREDLGHRFAEFISRVALP